MVVPVWEVPVYVVVVVVVDSSANNLLFISCESFSFPSRIIYPCILFVNEKSKTVNDISNLKFFFIFRRIVVHVHLV